MARPTAAGIAATRAGQALRRPENWLQLLEFSIVGASGYVVNLAVYVALLKGAGLHYIPSAACSFVVAVSNNYVWNRRWTFRNDRGHVYYQGLRFLLVSLVALGLNLAVLHILVALGLGKIVGQALAIVLVTPFSFSANKLWSFR
ncbi:MAG TPA: GtrA family protein [Gaiellaceae bacterium]|nr:GtrA family protein [Gaiellaceae bacterium]